MEKIKLIYISSDIISKVIEGQVYNLLEYYITLNVFSDIVLLQPCRDEIQLSKAKEVLSNYSFRVEFLTCRPLAPHKYFDNIRSLKNALKKEMTDNSVIHVRGSLSAPFVRKALPSQYKKAYILADFRGLVVPEIKVAHKGRLLDYLLVYFLKIPYAKYLEKCVFKDENTYITVVSPYFMQILVEDGVPKDRICVHPNIVSQDFIFSETDRRNIRKKYGIDEKCPVAVISSSGGTKWQNDSVVVDRLQEIGFVVLNLSRNAIEKSGVINEFLPRSEMPKYLSAADVAILWRENNPLNKVACPSKFGEFVTMGLYAIHNGTVDIAKRFIEDNNAGIIVSSSKEIEVDLRNLDIESRKKRSEAGFKLFSVECIAKDYISHYKNKN